MEEMIQRFRAQVESGHVSDPLSAFLSIVPLYSSPNHLTDMLNDEDRNSKYFSAIRNAIAITQKAGKKAIVLDIGCGTGLLSMMAAVSGADEIYACEVLPWKIACAKKVLERNGLSDRIKLIPKKSTLLEIGSGRDIPKKANILVTEIFDSELIGEDAISTFNHAHQFLLTADAVVIPRSATVFAQLVVSQYVRDMRSFRTINISENLSLTFPAKKCSESTNAYAGLHLTNFRPGLHFQKLSNVLEVFKFAWQDHGSRIPDFRSSKVEFVANRSGRVDGVFCWWELSLDDENLISCAPAWANQPAARPRTHWSQNLHFGMDPILLHEGTTCFLESFHDNCAFWFKPTLLSTPVDEDMVPHSRNRSCRCRLHDVLNRRRMQVLNDGDRNEKYVRALKKVIVPGETVCLCLSEYTLLPRIAVALGAKKVLILTAHDRNSIFWKSSWDWERLNIAEQRRVVESVGPVYLTPGNRPSNLKVDLVMGDPYFPDKSRTKEKHSWDHLKFASLLNYFATLDGFQLKKDAVIIPKAGRLMGLGLKLENLQRSKMPVGRACAGQFDMTDYDRQFLDPGRAGNSLVEAEFLWEHSGTASSQPFLIREFVMSLDQSGLGPRETSGHFDLELETNGVALWMEWALDDEEVISTGPTGPVSLGSGVDWDMRTMQGLYMPPSPWAPESRVDFEVGIDSEGGRDAGSHDWKPPTFQFTFG